MNMPRGAFPQYACSDALPRATSSIIWHITVSDLIMFIHCAVTRRQPLMLAKALTSQIQGMATDLVMWW
jgi:hypothetical protein